jgi:dihydroxyacetone kinase
VLPSNSSLEDAVMAVKEGAGKTRKMKAKLLETNIVCGGGEGSVGVPPDPGAWGVANLVVGFQRYGRVPVSPPSLILF